jgi:hypothetical protein
MKFKALTQKLFENEENFSGGLGQPGEPTRTSRSAVSDIGAFRIENGEQFERINSFLSAFGSRDYIDPKGAIALLRAKLNLVGLDFKFTMQTPLNVGENIFQVTRYGGTFGTTPDHDLLKDGFLVTDGIKEFNGGIGMELHVNVSKNKRKLYVLDIFLAPDA